MAWFPGWNWNTSEQTGTMPLPPPPPGFAQDVIVPATVPNLKVDVNMLDEKAPTLKNGFAVGEIVDYYSSTQGGWIPAKVVGLNPSGTYILDCKPDVPVEKIRQRTRPVLDFNGNAEFQVGELVEYNSSSQGKWILARVVAMNPAGTYDLDCKPDVPADKVRRPSQNTPTAQGAPGTPVTVPSSPAESHQRRPPQPPQSELENPVQLVRVQRSGCQWKYALCPEGIEYLERHGSRRIAVASMCGLHRTGKSYLLNLLMERTQRGKQLFQVGSTTRACTEGLWLWGSLGGLDDERSPLMAFVDCEGFGSTESDQTRDAQLMTLCALMSSVMVLNTRGALNEGLFNSLALTCRFSEYIQEQGNEASRPSLLWVLRDFMLELQDSSGRSLTPDEYLEQALQATTFNGQEDRNIRAREARHSLQKFFSHRSCSTLVQPAVDENELQNLASLPYASLRGEFKAGVDALRAQIVAACHASPKTIGGEPIGCRSFAALMRQLVEALNDNRSVSVRGAWEAVQHTTCGRLVDQLRSEGTQVLRSLASGQRLASGEVLPMPDEVLREYLRRNRHELKSQWEDMSVGEVAVRKEYWQELKEGLAREEGQVRQQNARLADQKLTEIIRRWQEWLDDDEADPALGERMAKELGKLMERVPTAPLSRAGRSALDAAARRVAASRAAIFAAVEHYSETQRRAEVFGAQAFRQEGATRSELGAKDVEYNELQDNLRRIDQECEANKIELQGRKAELQNAKTQVQASLQDMEDARQRELELRAQQRITNEREVALRAELEEARTVAARAESDRIAAASRAKVANETFKADIDRIQKEVQSATAEVSRLADLIETGRTKMSDHHEGCKREHSKAVEETRRRLDAERSSLKDEHDKTRMEHDRVVSDLRQKLDETRTKHDEVLTSEQNRLLECEKRGGVHEGQVTAVSDETMAMRQKIKELQATLREAEGKASTQRTEGEKLNRDLEKTRAQAEAARAELEAHNKAREKLKAQEKVKQLEHFNSKKKGSFFRRSWSKASETDSASTNS